MPILPEMGPMRMGSLGAATRLPECRRADSGGPASGHSRGFAEPGRRGRAGLAGLAWQG